MTIRAGHDVERDGHDHHRRTLPLSTEAEVTRSHTSQANASGLRPWRHRCYLQQQRDATRAMNATPRLSGLQKSRCVSGVGRFSRRQASSGLLFALANEKCSGAAVRRCCQWSQAESGAADASGGVRRGYSCSVDRPRSGRDELRAMMRCLSRRGCFAIVTSSWAGPLDCSDQHRIAVGRWPSFAASGRGLTPFHFGQSLAG